MNIQFVRWGLASLLLGLIAGSAIAAANIPIYRIQGFVDASPFNGKLVSTQGVITQFGQQGQDFWIQDPEGDEDPASSDGILVHRGAQVRSGLRPGDLIELTAWVEEKQYARESSITRLVRARDIRVIKRNQPVPDPVWIRKIPTADTSKVMQFWERMEGMRVYLDQAVVIGPTDQYRNFSALSVDTALTHPNYAKETGLLYLKRPEQPNTHYNPSRIVIDASELESISDLKPGDAAMNVVGVMHYGFGSYRIVADSLSTRQSEQHITDLESWSENEHELTVVTMNLENLFNRHQKRGLHPKVKLEKIRRSITELLKRPDIIMVQEIEDRKVLQKLVKLLNRKSRIKYRAVSFDSSDSRGIDNGVLWRTDRLKLDDAFLLDDEQLQTHAKHAGRYRGREPLVASLRYGKQSIHVVVNHLISKRRDDPLFGRNQPPQRRSELVRHQQARVIRAYLNARYQSEDQMLIVAGDFNDFEFAEPGEHPDTLSILRDSETGLQLYEVTQRIPWQRRFSYIYRGNAQLLDHILVSPALLSRLKSADIAHVNSVYPHRRGFELESWYRFSDHDPVVARFDMRARQ